MAFLWIDSTQKLQQNYEPSTVKRVVGPVQKIESDSTTSNNESPFILEGDLAQYEHKQQAEDAYQKAASLISSSQKVILAEEIMSAPVKSLSPSTTLTEAITFAKSHRFRHIPLANEDGIAMGILSDRDLFKYYYENKGAEDLMLTEIQNLITSKILTASSDTRIREIARVLFEERIGAMPIVDSKGTLEGIITRSDILRVLIHKAPLELWV